MRKPNTRAIKPDEKMSIPKPPVHRLPGKPAAGVAVGVSGCGTGTGEAVLLGVGSRVPKMISEIGFVGVTTV
jgi:hypothetical protein